MTEQIKKDLIYFAEMRVKKKGKSKFILDVHNERVINEMARHTANIDKASKGFGIFGSNGRGKTILLQAHWMLLKTYYPNVTMQYVTETQIIECHKKDDFIKWQNLINTKVLFIDELGSKKSKQNNYGETHPIVDFMRERAEKEKRLNFVTMNLPISDKNESVTTIETVFGGRTASRLNRIINPPFYLDGKDKS